MNAPDPIDDALATAVTLVRKALPQFDWGASALDAEAIQILNEFPAKVAAAITHREQERARLEALVDRVSTVL